MTAAVAGDGLAGLAPAALLHRLELVVTRRLDGLLHGDHVGLVPGAGLEPGDNRLYRVGDDLRRMDWAVTARTGVPHVREAVADRELETWLVVDCSASMDFGTADREKRDLATAATAGVGLLTARGGNRLGALVLTAQGLRRVPARPGRQPLLALLRMLVDAPRSGPIGTGGTDLASALAALRRPPRRRGLVVVVSDFLAADGWQRELRALAGRHQVLGVEVVDPRELELPAVGALTLVDPETGRLLDVRTTAALRQRYAAAAGRQRAAIARQLRSSGCRHVQLRTDRDWVSDLARAVSAGRARRSW